MMTSEVVAKIKRQLGYKTTGDADILSELAYQQRRFERGVPIGSGVFFPWFLQSELGTGKTLANEQRMPLKENWIKELDSGALWLYLPNEEEEEQWKELVKGDTDELRYLYPGSGQPRAYSLQLNYLRLFPIPNDAYTLKIIGLVEQEVPTVSPDNEPPWLRYAPFLLINAVVIELASALGNREAKGLAENNFLIEVRRLHASNEARDMANRRWIMGGRD